ncbi:MAG: methylated-DNA--[protein]-cysteine S-methyltransferase [Candidatus Limnocylindria bacterium]
MPPLRFAGVESFLGPMLVAQTDLGIAAVSRADALDAFLAALRRRFPGDALLPGDVDASWLIEALAGAGELAPPIDTRGLSAFDARAYDVVRSIPRGSTLTYGEVAALIGSTGAARAVGGAMSRCPLFPAVPCHRVVRAADGWSGWGGDSEFKRRLLRLERRARLEDAG